MNLFNPHIVYFCRSTSTKTVADSLEDAYRVCANGKIDNTVPSNHCKYTEVHGNLYSAELHSNHKKECSLENENKDTDAGRQDIIWSPSNLVAIEKHSNDEIGVKRSPDVKRSMSLPSLDYICAEFEQKITSSFMKKLPLSNKSSPREKPRVFKLFRLTMENSKMFEPEPSEMKSEKQFAGLAIQQKQKIKTSKLVTFAKDHKREIDRFLWEHELETRRRPSVSSLAHMDRFKQKHPELYSRMKARLRIPDSDLYELNNYLCDVYCEDLRCDGPAFLMMQKLEDIVDFIINLYSQHCRT